MIRKEVIQNFERLTSYPLIKFLTETESFLKKDYQQIINFYRGITNFLDKSVVVKLNNLTENAIVITNLFYEKKGVMKTVDFWELLDIIEDLKSKLQYAQKTPKYVRSSILSGVNKSGQVFDYVLSDEQTLENVSSDVLEEQSPNNSWVQTALDNDLKENDWDISGGKKLRLTKQIFQSNLVTSMIDNTIGEKIYGKDIKKLLEFKDNDLRVLSYRDTVFQTVDILSTLSKDEIPEFPELGLDGNIYKGSNFSQLNYPSIANNLRLNFASDDLFKDFEIKSIDYREGDIFIEFKVDTKYELTVIRNVTL